MEPCSTPWEKPLKKHMVSCTGLISGAFLHGEKYCHGNILNPFKPANSKTASQTQATKTQARQSFLKIHGVTNSLGQHHLS